MAVHKEKRGEATRADLDELLVKEPSDALDRKQKRRLISDLVQETNRPGH